MINLILFGPPGSGKGTQAAKLVEKYGLLHISTGDLFRYEMGNKTPLGLLAMSYMDKGDLVPDQVTMDMLRNKVEANPDVPGYIFDGVPRTILQCEIMDAMLDENQETVTKLLMLDVEEEELVERVMKRGITSGRADDTNEEIVRNRIQVYTEQTSQVFDYYAERGISAKINGIGDIDAIFNRLCEEIDAAILA